MACVTDSIESSALPREDSVLRAVFSQVTAEVRKKGLVLNEEDGSFYVSKRFSWKGTIKDFFDAYHKICERKQIHPIYQESKLTSALKVPYASIDTINLFHDGVAKRLLQFRDRRVPPFSQLPENPSPEDLLRIRKVAKDDKDFCRFIDLVLLVDEELRAYVAQLDALAAAYMLRVSAFSMALRGTGKESEVKKKYNDSKSTIEKILAPYISKLKKLGALPSSWSYSFKSLPLTDDCKGYLATAGAAGYWNSDVLPLKTVSAKEEPVRKPVSTPRKPSVRAPKVELSGPSSWHRFDKGVTRIGNKIDARIGDILEWVLQGTVWLLAIWAALVVISLAIFESVLTAVIVVAIGAALYKLLLGIAEIIAVVVQWIFSAILYLVRYIFYRGWTLILTLSILLGIMIYCFLEANYLI